MNIINGSVSKRFIRLSSSKNAFAPLWEWGGFFCGGCEEET